MIFAVACLTSYFGGVLCASAQIREAVQQSLDALEAPDGVVALVPTLPRRGGAEAQYLRLAVESLLEHGAVHHVVVFGALPAALQKGGDRVSVWARPEWDHPQLSRPAALARNFGDPLEKVLWRSRLVLDFATAMRALLAWSEVVFPKSALMWFEDDVMVVDGFGAEVERFLAHPPAGWVALRFLGFDPDPDPSTWAWGTQGFGGKGVALYNRHWLPAFLNFCEENFDAAPLDWLVEMFDNRSGSLYRMAPPKMRHIGEYSTHLEFD
mmetsp:Transcript_10467/g.23017  ORF Transcript_10467/g.23017 Transcript_10467/m.23017 type:complete len:267 (+) Transcript_10467:44-844(+)